MPIQQLDRLQTRQGFTIVELLIVIVVIAVLAAISIVAYSGITERARESQMLSDLTNAAKKFEIYNAQYGVYPYNATQMRTTDVRMSFTPVNSNVFSCTHGSGTGYAIYARYPSTTKQYRVIKGQAPQIVEPLVEWNATTVCATTPYTSANWGDFWITGG